MQKRQDDDVDMNLEGNGETSEADRLYIVIHSLDAFKLKGED